MPFEEVRYIKDARDLRGIIPQIIDIAVSVFMTNMTVSKKIQSVYSV